METFSSRVQSALSKLGMMSGIYGGGEGEDPEPELTPKQREDWNRYVDWLKSKGYSGSKDLDKKETGLARKLLEDFRKENPDATITYDNVKQVQMEMQKLQANERAFAQRRNDPNATKIMEGISKVDGWPGSKTTQFKFPSMVTEEYKNGELVQRSDLGLLSGMFKPSGTAKTTTKTKASRPLPPGVKLEEVVDASGKKSLVYEDPSTGDLVRYEK